MKPPTRTTHGRPAEVSKTPAAIQTAPVPTPGISRGREFGKGAAAASGKSAARIRWTGDEASSTPPLPKPLPTFPLAPYNVVITGLGDELPPLVPTPACANPRKDGPCFACAYCKATAAGPEWWLLDPAALTAALLKASVDRENAAISEFCFGVAKQFMEMASGAVVAVQIPSLLAAATPRRRRKR